MKSSLLLPEGKGHFQSLKAVVLASFTAQTKPAAQSFVGIFVVFFSRATSLAVCIHAATKYDTGQCRTVMFLKHISIYYQGTTMPHSSQRLATKEGINTLWMPRAKPPIRSYFEKCSSHHANSHARQVAEACSM